ATKEAGSRHVSRSHSRAHVADQTTLPITSIIPGVPPSMTSVFPAVTQDPGQALGSTEMNVESITPITTPSSTQRPTDPIPLSITGSQPIDLGPMGFPPTQNTSSMPVQYPTALINDIANVMLKGFDNLLGGLKASLDVQFNELKQHVHIEGILTAHTTHTNL